MAMNIIGINAYHGDASAVLIRDGVLAAAMAEERLRRVKHWAGVPTQSLRECIALAGLESHQIDLFAVARDPRAHLWRKVVFTLLRRPRLGLARERVRNAVRLRALPEAIAGALGLDPGWVGRRMRPVEHHPAHLASTFFVSPFEEAAVCALDGFGDFVSTSWGLGRGTHCRVLKRIYFPHSLGLLYLAITQYLGFGRYGDEYKVMGLAAHGAPDFTTQLRQLLHLTPEGGFTLDLDYFRHWAEPTVWSWDGGEPVNSPVYSPRLETLLGPARRPDQPLGARHSAIAASLQAVFEDAVTHLLNALHRRTRLPRLALAGGCALNSVMNGKVRERTPFREVYIQPAAADDGTALGAAFYLWHHVLGRPRRFVMEHAYWGPPLEEEAVRLALEARSEALRRRCGVRRIDDQDLLCRWTAEQVARGKIVGWVQGRMEWGPRALGNRSILADPRRADIRDVINEKIKLRESFRPLAPSILAEAVDAYFVDAVPDPFMIQVYPVRPERRAIIPAVTHVDGTGRLHAVRRDANPLFWKLLKAFEALTGVPVLVNTSLNENEPIVRSPAEALDCFLRTGMDVLVVGRFALEKGPVGGGAPRPRSTAADAAHLTGRMA